MLEKTLFAVRTVHSIVYYGLQSTSKCAARVVERAGSLWSPTWATRPCAYRLHSSMGGGGAAGEKPSYQDLVGSEWDVADKLVFDT